MAPAICGRLAQLVEHLVYTERVGGSSPSPPTITRTNAGSNQLAGDLGNRFDMVRIDSDGAVGIELAEFEA